MGAIHRLGRFSKHTGTPRSIVTAGLEVYDRRRANDTWQRPREGSLGSEQLCAVLEALAMISR